MGAKIKRFAQNSDHFEYTLGMLLLKLNYLEMWDLHGTRQTDNLLISVNKMS